MKSSVASYRGGRKATRRLDVEAMRALLLDGRIWSGLGVVIDPGHGHFEIVTDRGATHVLLEVELQPHRVPVTCRLATGDGAGGGLWRIPPIGAEVAVMVPDGELDFQPVVVAVLDSGSPPDRIAGDRTILVAVDRVEIISPDVRLGTGEAAHPLLRGDDLVSGTTEPARVASVTLGTATGIAATALAPATPAGLEGPLQAAVLVTWLAAMTTYLTALVTAYASAATTISPTVRVP